MIPAAFDYEVAESLEHAISLLGERDQATLLAGGHSLVPALKLRLARPRTIVDIGRLADLAYVREDGDAIAIGALTRHKAVAASTVLQEHCAIVAHVAGQIGDPQVRHRGTIGGSIAHAAPNGDMSTVLLALGVDFVARGPVGERTIAASDFTTGAFQTALAPGEMLVEIRVPKLGSSRWSYRKMSRRAQDWATVGVAVVERNGEGTAIALTSMGPKSLRAAAAEEALAGGASIADASALAAEGTQPPSDQAGSSDFRKHLARVLTRRALEEASAGT